MLRRSRDARGPARGILLVGPAFVASIAYVDPGNVASNLTGGSRFGYLLVWVVVAVSIAAAVVQYQSAKLGLVTGRSLPELLGDRLRTGPRIAFWLQAEFIAIATDLAEVIGGAIALYLLFGLPLVVGGIVVGIVSMLLLTAQSRYGQRPFESIIMGLLAIITIGFLAGLFINPPDASGVLRGLVPRFEGVESVLIATSMLGATIMPHAIYVHSALARDRHGRADGAMDVARLLRGTKWDVSIALGLAGIVNVGMLLLAAVNLRGVGHTDTIVGAHDAIQATLGPVVAGLLAVGLLASGLASTSVGSYAGATIMAGLLRKRIPLFLRRVITLLPAIAILGIGVDPTVALIASQVVLSFGIPFALVPLLSLTNNRAVMGAAVNGRAMTGVLGLIVVLVVALNAALIVLAVIGA